jgi:hypothetical protein
MDTKTVSDANGEKRRVEEGKAEERQRRGRVVETK